MFALLSLLYVLLSAWGLRVAFAAPADTITVGKKGLLRARIKNKSVLPVFYAEILVEMAYYQSSEVLKLRLPFSAIPGKTELLRLPVTVRYAGTLRVVPRYIVVYDFLHVFCIRKKIKCKPTIITVLPEFQQMFVEDHSSRFNMPLVEERTSTDGDDKNRIQQFYKDRVGDDPSEVFQMREYHIGDKLSRVDWKISAKAGNLMVKDYSFPIIDRTVIFVDMHCRGQLEFHQRIHTAVALCVSVLEIHCSMTLAWYDETSQMVLQRHLEQDEDLFESIGMLVMATYCRELSPAETLLQLSLSCQVEQLIYITGAVREEDFESLERLERAKRIWIYSIEKKEMSTKRLSEKLRCDVLPQDHLEEALAQIQVELY
jgi:hypothetical protein